VRCSPSESSARSRSTCASGRFREDLFYRLAVGHIEVPPLRARGADILLLAGLFRERCAAQMGKRVTGFGSAAVDALAAHPWPGNVRQLRNEIERAVILSDGPIIEALALTPTRAPAPVREPEPEEAPARRPSPSRAEIEAALTTSRGNVVHAARLLATNPKQVYRWMERFELSAEKFRP
jgi:DNA-binding NtrC family response regulator